MDTNNKITFCNEIIDLLENKEVINFIEKYGISALKDALKLSPLFLGCERRQNKSADKGKEKLEDDDVPNICSEIFPPKDLKFEDSFLFKVIYAAHHLSGSWSYGTRNVSHRKISDIKLFNYLWEARNESNSCVIYHSINYSSDPKLNGEVYIEFSFSPETKKEIITEEVFIIKKFRMQADRTIEYCYRYNKPEKKIISRVIMCVKEGPLEWLYEMFDELRIYRETSMYYKN